MQNILKFLKHIIIKDIKTGKQVYELWGELKPVRDCFLDWLDALLETECDMGDLLCNTFENLYNTLLCVKTFDENAHSYDEIEFEVYKIYIWELFICTTAFLRYYEKYDVLNAILSNTYFLTTSVFSTETKPCNYFNFRFYSKYIDESYKREIGSRLITVTGNTLCCERERKPIFTKTKLALADLFLYQVGNGFISSNSAYSKRRWFPLCYVCCEDESNGWEKLVSKRYCKNICTLFGVSSVEELKQIISACVSDENVCFRDAFSSAPAILKCISLENIGTMG